jgi:hypothetical protein
MATGTRRGRRDVVHGRRLRGLGVVLWRAGLPIDEALALREAEFDRRGGSLLVRRGKGGDVARSEWTTGAAARAVAHHARRAADRSTVLHHQQTNARTPVGHQWGACRASARRRSLRQARAVEMARAGVPLIVIQRQLGRSNLGILAPYRGGASACAGRPRRCAQSPRAQPAQPNPPGLKRSRAMRRADHLATDLGHAICAGSCSTGGLDGERRTPAPRIWGRRATTRSSCRAVRRSSPTERRSPRHGRA